MIKKIIKGIKQQTKMKDIKTIILKANGSAIMTNTVWTKNCKKWRCHS